MLYPILPIFLTKTLHASGSVVGLVEGIAETTQNVVQGLSGWLSDKLQKKKSLALAGYPGTPYFLHVPVYSPPSMTPWTLR